MKHLLTILFFIMTTLTHSQVDIRLSSISDNQLDVDLIPNDTITSVLSSVVFTIKSEESITFTETDVLTVLDEVFDNGNYYTSFVYFGMSPQFITQRTYELQKMSGGFNIQIVNDDYTELNNRNFYVAIGGVDVTGEILQLNTTVKEIKQINDSRRRLFYDHTEDRWVILFNGKWTDIYGRSIHINPRNLLGGFSR